MTTFKNKDAVFCPALSTKPLMVFTKINSNGVFINFRGNEYWFSNGGVLGTTTTKGLKTIPSLFLATEDNRQYLSALYDTDFEIHNTVPIYAVNVLSHDGSGSDDWVFPSQEGYYDYHSVKQSENFTKDLLWYDILVTPSLHELEEALESEPVRGKVVCVGNESIWIWCNKD